MESPVRAPDRVAKGIPDRQTTRRGGQDMAAFMATGSCTTYRVVRICSEAYVTKADGGAGGRLIVMLKSESGNRSLSTQSIFVDAVSERETVIVLGDIHTSLVDEVRHVCDAGGHRPG